MAEPAAAPHTSETTRLEAFSDGVFAIAITLLILDVKRPTPDEVARAGGLAAALGAQWPSLFAYALSFATIGIMWINHHAMLQYIRRADRTLLLLHVAFLGLVSFVPFPTALMAEMLHEPAARDATLLYGALFAALAVAYNAIWWYGIRDPQLVDPHAPPDGLRRISRRYAFGPALYVAATLLALASVNAALVAFVLLAGLFALPDRRRSRPRRRA
jgi:uncharacterized membrane protein